MNPLLKAAQFNRLEIVRILVENGAKVDFIDKFGNTALMIASQKGHVDLAEYLIEQNADVNAETLIGYTPLLYALEFGQPEIAEILIENGADVNVIDKYNRSALIHAAARGYSELVETLINKGVDPDIRNDNEETAAVIAQQHEFDDIVDFLVDSGADTTGLVFVDSAAVAEAELIAEMYDTPPEPVGGLEAVQKKLRYPKDAEEAGLEGTVTVRVTVDRRGRVNDTEVIESFGDEDCDTAAQRAVRGARWKAAQKDNKRVEAWVDIPVEFTLEE